MNRLKVGADGSFGFLDTRQSGRFAGMFSMSSVIFMAGFRWYCLMLSTKLPFLKASNCCSPGLRQRLDGPLPVGQSLLVGVPLYKGHSNRMAETSHGFPPIFRRVGHASTHMIEQVCGHLTPSYRAQQMGKFDIQPKPVEPASLPPS